MKSLMKRISLMFLILPLVIGLAVANADALALDLTTAGSSGIINGTIFYTTRVGISGDIDTFLEIQGSGDSEAGYNTDGTPEFDTVASHSLLLSDMQTNIVDISGINYYEFVLDVNETGSSSLITLNDFEFYIDGNSDNSGYSGFGTPAYDFDDGPEDNSVTVDYSNYKAGEIDLFALVPTSYFGADYSQYVYLYTSFDQVSDGREKWARKTEGTFTPDEPIPPEPIPEPATVLLFLTGIMGFLGIKRKRL